MAEHDQHSSTSPTEVSAFPWILEHLLAYPGTYEIPLRTMYTLNATTQNHQRTLSGPILNTPGNAFPRAQKTTHEDQQNLSTATAAAQLRANLMSHISQLPSQPTSLPPSFITSFVSKCFAPELERIDFPHALTAMDYLKDLEIRRRREVLAALDKLGVDRNDIGHRDRLAKKYPGVLQWVIKTEENERNVEALYTQVYIGLRRWTLINELSLTPFNKSNCIAMLNTLYPPTMGSSSQFTQPTAQLSPQILSTQRTGFFRYITAVERNGTTVLKSLMDQHKRPGDASGWTSYRETLDRYLRMANYIIDECQDVSASSTSPLTTSFSSGEYDDEDRRKVDSGISFGSTNSSNRNSGQSHTTRPSTSSSLSTHSRITSRDKQLPEKPLPIPVEADDTIPAKPAGSTLERIVKELRKIKSRGNMRDEPKSSAMTEEVPDLPRQPPSTPTKDRLKRSLKKMRSSGVLKESNNNSRPASREDGVYMGGDVPAFDAEEMKKKRAIWEVQQGRKGGKYGHYAEVER